MRAATEPDHRRLELALDLLDPALSLERYRAVLAAFWGFYAPLEVSFRRFAGTAPPRDFALPDRARLLAQDLDALGVPLPRPRCADLPAVASLAELAGCLYVVEGAALGGQVLARELENRWSLRPDAGLAFFHGEGPRATKRRWQRVLDWLDRVDLRGTSRPDTIAAASATFDALERWLAAQAPRPGAGRPQ